MSTHAVIVEQVPDGYRGIYVHFDGYIVNKVFNDPVAVNFLVNLGFSVSVNNGLSQTINDNKRMITTREELKHLESHIHHGYTIEDVTKYFIDKYHGNDGNIDYIYIFSKDTNKWYVDIPYRDMYNVPLEDILANKELCEELNNERIGRN